MQVRYFTGLPQSGSQNNLHQLSRQQTNPDLHAPLRRGFVIKFAVLCLSVMAGKCSPDAFSRVKWSAEFMNGLMQQELKDMKRVIFIVLALASQGSFAVEDVWQTEEANSAWQNECGSCHMAFPPALLTQGNWKQLMQELDTHFGVNASLDTKTREEITAFLERNSGTNGWRSAESLRITQTGWFVKRHVGGMKMMEDGRIKSLADCVACHK